MLICWWKDGAFPEVQLTMVSQLHDVLLSEITVAGMDDPPAEIRALFESFLRGIQHIAVHWQHNEVLLFTDPEHVELLDTNEFRSATALEHHRKNVQLGLRIGQAALIEFELYGQFMKAIWILMNNKLPSQKGGSDPLSRNSFWKFVVPTVSYFAWLPECLARTFCVESLATFSTRLYADSVLCLADLEGYEGPRGVKFGVPAALCGLTQWRLITPRSYCENHARKMRTFFTRRLEPKTKSSNAFKWSLRPKRK